MSPRKLTAADKKEIVKVYRSSAENTAALATRYGVSNSTVSRLLKSHIPEAEYEILMSGKRGQKSEFGEEETPLELLDEVDTKVVAATDAPTEQFDQSLAQQIALPIAPPPKPVKKGASSEPRRVRRRSSALLTTEEETTEDGELSVDTSLALPAKPIPIKPITKAAKSAAVPVVVESTIDVQTELPLDGLDEEDDQEGLSIVADILGEEMGDLLDEEEEEFNEEEDWSYGLTPSVLACDVQVQVLPLSAANLPRTCYIVIDKFAELVAKPLREFAELGNIPADEVPQQTLPVFDNHRVAKRFSSSHTNRVIKVPDSGLFQKTSRHLEAKGITRLLVDGQIYSLQ
jgi:transposase-like protein